jgi:hypothetical protein
MKKNRINRYHGFVGQRGLSYDKPLCIGNQAVLEAIWLNGFAGSAVSIVGAPLFNVVGSLPFLKLCQSPFETCKLDGAQLQGQQGRCAGRDLRVKPAGTDFLDHP